MINIKKVNEEIKKTVINFLTNKDSSKIVKISDSIETVYVYNNRLEYFIVYEIDYTTMSVFDMWDIGDNNFNEFTKELKDINIENLIEKYNNECYFEGTLYKTFWEILEENGDICKSSGCDYCTNKDSQTCRHNLKYLEL